MCGWKLESDLAFTVLPNTDALLNFKIQEPLKTDRCAGRIMHELVTIGLTFGFGVIESEGLEIIDDSSVATNTLRAFPKGDPWRYLSDVGRKSNKKQGRIFTATHTTPYGP